MITKISPTFSASLSANNTLTKSQNHLLNLSETSSDTGTTPGETVYMSTSEESE